MKNVLLLLIGVVLVLSLQFCPAEAYKIRQSVVGTGGTESVGTNFGIRSTVGQHGTGKTDSDLFAAKVGYYHLYGTVVTGADDPNTTPKVYSLDQNVPNPFNPMTTIRFTLPARSHVTLAVYDVSGQLVATLVDSEMPAGIHDESFDARGLASGVYFYRIGTKGFSQSRKLVVLK